MYDVYIIVYRLDHKILHENSHFIITKPDTFILTINAFKDHILIDTFYQSYTRLGTKGVERSFLLESKNILQKWR